MSFVNVYQIVYVSFFTFCIEAGTWDVIVLISDFCLSFYYICSHIGPIALFMSVEGCSFSF